MRCVSSKRNDHAHAGGPSTLQPSGASKLEKVSTHHARTPRVHCWLMKLLSSEPGDGVRYAGRGASIFLLHVPMTDVCGSPPVVARGWVPCPGTSAAIIVTPALPHPPLCLSDAPLHLHNAARLLRGLVVPAVELWLPSKSTNQILRNLQLVSAGKIDEFPGSKDA